MEKVKVSKVVAGWIENIKFELAPGCKHEKHILLRNLMADRANQLGGLDIDIVTLAKAIQYGYEVPYEHKENDLVKWKRNDRIYEVTEEVFINDKTVAIKTIKQFPHEWILMCKAEERRDLKQ